MMIGHRTMKTEYSPKKKHSRMDHSMQLPSSASMSKPAQGTPNKFNNKRISVLTQIDQSIDHY